MEPRNAVGRGAARDRDRHRVLDGRRRGAAARSSHELALAFDARLVVDEAHATGNLGPGGRGAVAEAGLEGEIDVVVGTLGKALGAYGAYACASAEMVSYLINTRALADLLHGAAAARRRGRARRARPARGATPSRAAPARERPRAARAALAEEGFPVAVSDMHIVPLIVGEERDAMRTLPARRSSAACSPRRSGRRRVPAGTSRLRLTAMASHTHSELELAAGVFGQCARELGIDPEALLPAPAERVPAPVEPEPVAAPATVHRIGVADRGAVAGALFDFERDGPSLAPFDAERDASAAAARLEQDTELHDTLGSDEPDAQAPGANAPFDLEREPSNARAA